MTDTDNPLLTELREPRDVLSRLTPEESCRLSDLLRHAKAAQLQQRDAALDEGLKVIPRPIRIPARKILFGK